MTARKRVISIISIISLILAITAGVLLSVGAPNNNYVGDSVRLSNTDVTINANSSVKSGEYPADAVGITTSEELQKFIKGEEGFDGTYGYLTENISLDWAGVGAQAYLASGRTIDGNGKTVTLSDAEAVANVSNKTGDGASLSGTDGVVTGYAGGYTDPLDGRSDAAMRNYGMFVDYNMGTIKNIKFVYFQEAHSVANNSGALWKNYAGIVCGTNSGTISNCDLTVSGEFGYYYCSGNLAIDNYDAGGDARETFATYFGGIAGRNGGTITFITAKYSNFSAKLNTRAQNFTQGKDWLGRPKDEQQRADAVTDAGGIAGVMYSTESECSNIIIQASNDVSYTLVAQRNNYSSSKKGADVKLVAAVVPANSEYSRALGGIGGANAQARIDNIIVDFNATIGDLYVNGNKESQVSRNAVVFCGKATDVTIFNVEKNTDYETDHCGCVTSNEGRQHDTGYGNLIHTDDHTNVSVGFDSDGNQVITVEPKETQAHILGEVTFSKYEGKNGGNPIVENNPYAGVPGNGSMYVYNNVDARTGKYTFTIKPYQTSSSSRYWEINTYAYEVATISNVGEAEYTYTGEDYLLNQLSYTSSSKSGVVNPEGINARTADGKAITSGRLPGEYDFVLADKEAGLSYVDTQNKVVAFVEETPTHYTFKVNLAQITPLEASLIGENWMTKQQDFTFELAGGIEGAADGYQYEVGGSLPTPVTGLVMQNRQDTNSAGRTYKIELTSGGVVVTEPYTYTVKIDLTAPTINIIHYEHPADIYYTHNKITIEAIDKASGVASIVMNSYDGDSTTPDHSHDIMSEGIDNGDGTYTWKFQDTGRKEIVVTDNAGHSSTIEVKVKIDTFKPTINVDAYYYEDVEHPVYDNDGNTIPDPETGGIKTEIVREKKEYVSGTEVKSAVYFDASATFGESGGEIRYTLDGHTWHVYDGILTVKGNASVKFFAVSNTYTHPDDDVYPYPDKYQISTLWKESAVEVVIQLPEVVITLGDLVIENATKPFDGTNAFLGSVSVREGFEEDNKINGEVQITSVVYKDVNAGDSVELVISVFCTDDTKVMSNEIKGAVGRIEKKVIDVTIDNKTKIYGVSLPQLTYKQEGMVAGFEEDIELFVKKPDGYTGSYELLPQTADGEGYVIAIVEGMTFVNYTLGTETEGRLKVTLAPVDRLVYERGQFTGLDLNNIADRNLEIGFIRSNGNYERLNVTFYARDYYFDSSNNSFVDNGYTKKVDDITKAGAGFFKVVISLPERDAKGELLTDKYVMDEDITEFMIKIIDSTIFDVEEEEEPSEPDVEEDDKTEQETPAIDNGADGQVGIYEDGSANTDSTDMDIESAQQKKDYVAMISIFCAVAITIAFAIGIVRAIKKRMRG